MFGLDCGKVKKSSPFDLFSTHAITKTKSEFEKLLKEIKAEGRITESIKYVFHDGKKYIVDGHHRAYITKRLNMDVLTEEIELPHGAYKTVLDLVYEGKNPGYLKFIKF